MEEFQAIFEIVDQKNCPLYQKGERLLLSEKSLSCPKGKEACLILVRDLTQLLFQVLGKKQSDFNETIFNCSGCKGLIKFKLIDNDQGKYPKHALSSSGGAKVSIEMAVQGLYGAVVDSPFLRALPSDQLEKTMGKFSLVEMGEGKTLIRKGEANLNMYLLLEGSLVVENNGLVLAQLRSGEICGEMSYLGADTAVSTVKTSAPSSLLAISGSDFGELFGGVPAVQSFMARLMAERLTKNNVERAKDFESCMSGRLDMVAPAELLQIFHMHQKTGVLRMDFVGGHGHISFREGCIINARYGAKESQEAIFALLAEKEGIYRFTTGLSPQEMKAAEIGDFMMLLMEGVKRVDEAGQMPKKIDN